MSSPHGRASRGEAGEHPDFQRCESTGTWLPGLGAELRHLGGIPSE